ncbi:MAG: HEPN domain-containing protein [Patescibacteria group bacterium]|nr:HEPN domain-containing protein [Patescibacteria group bacterium]
MYLLEGGRYGAACFSSQQAVEKLLKAVIINKGKIHPKVHDLIKLAKDAEVESDKDKLVKLKLLTRHYWQVRYPDINKEVLR